MYSWFNIGKNCQSIQLLIRHVLHMHLIFVRVVFFFSFFLFDGRMNFFAFWISRDQLNIVQFYTRTNAQKKRASRVIDFNSEISTRHSIYKKNSRVRRTRTRFKNRMLCLPSYVYIGKNIVISLLHNWIKSIE